MMISMRSPSSDATDGASSECFGSDVSDACAGRDAGESGICDECDVFSVGEMFESGGDLVELFHSGP